VYQHTIILCAAYKIVLIIGKLTKHLLSFLCVRYRAALTSKVWHARY